MSQQPYKKPKVTPKRPAGFVAYPTTTTSRQIFHHLLFPPRPPSSFPDPQNFDVASAQTARFHGTPAEQRSLVCWYLSPCYYFFLSFFFFRRAGTLGVGRPAGARLSQGAAGFGTPARRMQRERAPLNHLENSKPSPTSALKQERSVFF